MAYYLPMLLAVGANILYNISAKSTSQTVNPFASLVIVYLIATLCSFGGFLLTAENQNILTELPKINWATFAMGGAVVGIEIGYLYMFRNGWLISSASIAVNILLAIALIFVGLFLYKDHISFYKIMGIGLCIAGLLFINKG